MPTGALLISAAVLTTSMPPSTRSSTTNALSTYRELCLGLYRNSPAHPSVERLPMCIAQAASEDLMLDGLDDWLCQTLLSLGFEKSATGVALRAPYELCEALLKEQNAARQQAHRDAAAAREALLDAELLKREPAAAASVGAARAAVRAFLREHADQPATGPVLRGAAALLAAQAAEAAARQAWRVERAALLNGGDDFVPRAVALLRSLALQPRADVEAGHDAPLVWELAQPSAWSAFELQALAVVCRRGCDRLPIGAAASGTVEPSAGAAPFAPRAHESLPQQLRSLVESLLCLLLA